MAGTDEAEWAARTLLAHVRECTSSELFAHPETLLSAQQKAAFQALVARRARHEPLAYLVGRRGFLELDLLVDRRVLIPRPETELLVERAIAWVRGQSAPVRIADVGTGSGAIAIGLAAALPRARIYALDHSPDAIEVVSTKALSCQIPARIAAESSLKKSVEGVVLELQPT